VYAAALLVLLVVTSNCHLCLAVRAWLYMVRTRVSTTAAAEV
jgi:hypothetical protein